jgi:hypothetical protein
VGVVFGLAVVADCALDTHRRRDVWVGGVAAELVAAPIARSEARRLCSMTHPPLSRTTDLILTVIVYGLVGLWLFSLVLALLRLL